MSEDMDESGDQGSGLYADPKYHALAMERDYYRTAGRNAVERVETQTSRVTGADGSLSGYFIDSETWREIRSHLQGRWLRTPPGESA